jgi:GT2 family glycosyltransferase
VRVVRNDRPGRPDTQPSQRNKVLDVARGGGDDPFVLVHNDIRPAHGWLDRLLGDLNWAEDRWGRGSSIVSLRYIPFHRLQTTNSIWSELWRLSPRQFKTIDQMAEWCAQWQFPFINGRVECPTWTAPTDNGHQLMMFAARPSFFDTVGACDEMFTGANYDDSEWGMRALMAGKRNLTSQTALVGHVEGLSFGVAGTIAPASNEEVFVRKWGRELFEELNSGRLWLRLHEEQRRGTTCVTSQ